MAGRYLFKVILAGEGGVGKTSLWEYFAKPLDEESNQETIGVDFSVGVCPTKYGQTVLQIWDFLAEERFKSMLPSFCLGSSGCVLLFDPTNLRSFQALEGWVDIVRKNTKDIPIYLASSKSDLVLSDHPSMVQDSEIAAFVSAHGLRGHLEVSSVTGEHVQELFNSLSEAMVERNMGR